MGAFPDLFGMTNGRLKGTERLGRVEVNQGLDVDLRLKNPVITGACLSSREDRVVLYCRQSGESRVI